MAAERRGSAVVVLGWRFRALVAAHAVSAYGTFLNLIALSLFSYEVTGTALGVAALMATRLLCGVGAGLVAGRLLTRVTRRTVLIGTDLAQAAAMTVLALCAAHPPLRLLLAVTVVMGAGNTLFNVALRSAVPVMVGARGRVRANGVLVSARSVATVLGFASAAPVIGHSGYAGAFAVNAASFVVSAAAVIALRPRTDEAPSHAPTASAPRPRRRTAGLGGLLLGMVLLRGVDALASSSHNIALPVVAHTGAPSDPAGFMTRFWAAWAVGTFLAHQVLKRRRHDTAWSERAFAVGTCVMSLSFTAAFTGLPAWGLVAAAAAAGFADGSTEIVYTSRLQTAPDQERSRLFGLSAMAETTGFALGTVAAGAALEALPAPAVVAVFHAIAVCGAVALFTAAGSGTGGCPPSSSAQEREDTHGTRTGAGSAHGS
ncbi:MFS transporter [Streptomyces sp. NPDC018693]|uniref:MFS transporter n=1 Tax=unclassified Streptomyces TaxID=2593676 RepID=UPI0037AEBA94